jgi:protein gp37
MPTKSKGETMYLKVSTQPDLESGIEDHLNTPAAWRGFSLEPLLGAIDLIRGKCIDLIPPIPAWSGDGVSHRRKIDSCIIGCESGPGRRLNSDYWLNDLGPELWMSWLREIIAQCDAARVPVHVKQIPIADGSKIGWRVSKDPSEWPDWARRRDAIR